MTKEEAMSEPTPQEAASALYEVSHRQNQVAQAAGQYPWWLWPGLGAVLATVGLIRDLTSNDSWTAQVLLGVVVVGLIGLRTRFIGARLGYQAAATARVRRGARRGIRTVLAVLVPVAVWGAAWALVEHHHSDWPNTITGVAFGLTVALVSPWILSWKRPSSEEPAGHVS
jgi:hypothetical protein